MKIEKKFKTFLLSSLTIFASAISVVGCGSKKDDGDQNYKDFVTNLEKIKLNDNLNNNSLENFLDKSGNPDIYNKNLSLSVNKVDPETLKFYNITDYDKKSSGDVINSEKFTSLKDGGVTYKDKNIFFNDVEINDILFAENFDLVVEWKGKKPDDSKMIFKNVTLFFKINSDKDNFSMADWNSLKTKFNVNTEPDYVDELKLAGDNNFDKNKLGLGVVNSPKNTNQAYWFTSKDDSNTSDIVWTLNSDTTKGTFIPHLFTVGNEDKLTVKKDSPKKGQFEFSFDSSNIFASFEIDGTAKKDGIDTTISAMFIGMFSKDNSTLKLDSNFFVDIDIK